MRVLQTIRAVWYGIVTLSVATAGFALVSSVPGSTVVMAQDAGVLTGNISPLDSGEDVLLTADEVTFDEALGVVTATGNVQVSQGERTIYADRMSYSVRDDTVAASGNVVLIEPTGEVFFSDYVELGDELRNGVIRDIRVLFADDSRLAGSGARRTDGRESEVRNAVFSPCKVCAEDGDDPPLWQIKARRIVHDQEKKQIRYYDPRLEFFGVPVLYSPYLQHTDPSVKRETGLMAPTFQGDDNLGFFFKQPVYWAIDKDKDATFIPFIATKQGPGLAFEYRQAFTSGYLEFFGSATIADRDEEDLDTGFKDTREDRFRAHVDIEGRFDITEDWRWGFDIERATDRTYLALYEWPHEQILTSNLFVEGFQGRNYASANIWEFQGLRDIDDNKSAITPNILPVIDWDWTTDAFGFGGRLHANVNLFNVRRKKGSTNQRVVVSADYELPYTTKFGDQYKVTASLRGDFYQVQDVPSPTPPHEDSGTTGRFFPRLAVERPGPGRSRRAGSP